MPDTPEEYLSLLSNCIFFQAEWYEHQPTVQLGTFSPVEHYLYIGAELFLDPGPNFSTRGYLETYPDVKQNGWNPLVHFLLHGQAEGRLPNHHEVLQLDAQLWEAENPLPAENKLQHILTSKTTVQARSFAAWALARHKAQKENWPAVISLLKPWRDQQYRLPRHNGADLLEIDALMRTKAFKEAEERLKQLLRYHPDIPDLLLAQSNLFQMQGYNDKHRLALLNRIWIKNNLNPISLPVNVPLTLDTLSQRKQLSSSPSSSLSERDLPLVSVIVPLFNAQKTLFTALSSLAHQTWPNLEILLVDDASNDATCHKAENFISHDTRFRLIRSIWNQGPYAARNKGLEQAQGTFITTHDADDWSHPQKIERQVQYLLEHPELVACTSHWVRCSNTLCFGRWRMEEGWIYRNVSSLMFRRQVFEYLGFWDTVAVEADTEYWLRIQKRFGERAVSEVLPGIPLSLGRTSPHSLTQTGSTHLITQFRGGRREYRKAVQNWHQSVSTPEQLYVTKEPKFRPFPIPRALQSAVREIEGKQLWKPHRPCILLVGHAALAHIFGGERSLLDLAQAFNGLEINLLISVPESENIFYLSQLCAFAHKVFSLATPLWMGDRTIHQGSLNNFDLLLRRFPIKLVYVNTIVLWEPLLAARLRGIPTVIHIRELPNYDPDLCAELHTDPITLRNHALVLSDYLVANSHATARWLNAPGRVHIIPNALKYREYPLSPPPLTENNIFRVCLLSSNIPKKGIKDFAILAGLLEKNIPHVECRLIGPQTFYRQELLEKQKRGEISPCLHFFDYTDAVQDAIASCHVLVNLSHFQESFGRTVLEAMLMGRPVVCYDWGALPELIVHGQTGFLAPFKNINKISEYLCILYTDPILQFRMGAKGRAYGIRHFNLVLFQERLNQLLHQLHLFCAPICSSSS